MVLAVPVQHDKRNAWLNRHGGPTLVVRPGEMPCGWGGPRNPGAPATFWLARIMKSLSSRVGLAIAILVAFVAGAAATTAVLVGPLGYRASAPGHAALATPSPGASPSPAARSRPSPDSRTSPSLAFDEARNQVVLFGGTGGDDTWTWDGKAWTLQHPAVTPPGRSGGAMTYDPDTKTVLLWGGYEANGQAADFWSWDGSGWTQIRSANFPPAQGISGWATPAPILTYDTKRHVVVLIRNSGNHPAVPQAPDVWTWDGSAWSHPAVTNAPVIWGTAAYDPSLGAVLFFGVDSSAKPQTWAFDGTSWTQQPSVLVPAVPGDDPPPMVYFKAANTAALVDGSGGIWTWDGDWTQKGGSASLPATAGYMVSEGTQGTLVRFGGTGEPGGQTWVWNVTSWTRAG
jgi:hypothetical protein